jgi:hypothetical protein
MPKAKTIKKVTEYEKIDDDTLITLIDEGITNSVGDFLNSAELSDERQKSTFEYGMIPQGHLSPQGVSQIVSSDTVEAIEGYTAIISELMFDNNKLCKFTPSGQNPKAYSDARVAADITNYEIFKKNPGWEILNTWIKSAFLWKNSHVHWEFVEDHSYSFEEYESISQSNLDIILAEPNLEIVGTLEMDNELVTNPETGDAEYAVVYKNVRLKRKTNKSRVKIKNVHPESFRISRGATSLDNAGYVGIEADMTRSEIRKTWPEESKNIDWDDIGDGTARWSISYSEERAARKLLVGETEYLGRSVDAISSEANTTIAVLESWIRVDRDGDGIAELKHVITVGSTILLEEDVDSVDIATICPFEVPHEFAGLSVADMVRPTTMATTAVLRGFIENVYLTNYSPKLADPNVVDFSALQNMKPKQIIATNGNPNGAVAAMTPDTISQGTVPLLEMLQLHKEQSTGLSKAAQGLNDALYVSGNSDEKMQRAQSAAQIRIQYMARRFAETGFKRLAEGVYKTIRTKLRGKTVDYHDQNDVYKSIDPSMLPDNMLLYIDADVGENSNSNVIKKMTMIGQQLIPALQAAGAGGAVNPEAAVRIACKTLEAMDLDPLDYLTDYTAEDFKAQAEESRKNEQTANEKKNKLAEEIQLTQIAQAKATLELTNTQGRNAMQDNSRQLFISLDKSDQEWAKLYISAAKEGVELPPRRSPEELLGIASGFITNFSGKPPVEVEQMGGPAAAPPEQPQ